MISNRISLLLRPMTLTLLLVMSLALTAKRVFIVNDSGRNGYYEQKTIARTMGEMAEKGGLECVFALGDVHHFDGVASVNDPLWLTNFELIYSHPELQVPWYPILGNHEYRGSTKAVMDYSMVSRRWRMCGRYYTKVFHTKGTSIRFVLADTTPMIAKYRSSEENPDANEQNTKKQLQWLDSVLSNAKEQWIVVMGHHPIYAVTPKAEQERIDMQNSLGGLLRRHRVDMYISGHIHNFQHIRQDGTDTDFIVNSAAALARGIQPSPATLFASGEAGFSVLDFSKEALTLSMVNSRGDIIYKVERKAK